MDLAGDDLREGPHVGTVERVGGKKLRSWVDLVEILDDRERLGQKTAAVLERGDQPLSVQRFVSRFQVLAFGQTYDRGLVLQALVVERDPHAKRRRRPEESVELHELF